MNYTRRELMVAAAAREIHDGERVFVGMRLPLLGFAVAKELHAPNALGIFENGVVRDWPALESIFTMSDPPNVARALCCGSLNDVMYLLQSGRVEAGFIGGAEVDRFGNLNTHWVEEDGKRVRKPVKLFAGADDLRQGFCSRWARRVMPAVLKRLMRHSSVVTTLRFYVTIDADSVADELWGKDWESGNTSGNNGPESAQKEQSPPTVTDCRALPYISEGDGNRTRNHRIDRRLWPPAETT